MADQADLFTAAPEQFPYGAPLAPPNMRQETNLWMVGDDAPAVARLGRYWPQSMVHPGKMVPRLAGAIFDTYARPGEWWLDPMCGIGTSLVEGMERGANVVGVELEESWAAVAQDNADLAVQRGAPGGGLVICDDARNLKEIMARTFNGGASACLLSPPYGSTLQPRAGRDAAGSLRRIEEAAARGDNMRRGPGSMERCLRQIAAAASARPGASAAFFTDYCCSGALLSPPFGPSQTGRGLALTGIGDDERPLIQRCGGVPYDGVLTSPPFGPSNSNGAGGFDAHRPGAIGNRPFDGQRGRNKRNIGNLPYREYLLQQGLVYQAVYQVLRPGALMIVVIKDFRRQGYRVDLLGDTCDLLDAAGFREYDRAVACLSRIDPAEGVIARTTPFVRLGARKMGQLLSVFEDVLIFRKPSRSNQRGR